DARVPSERHTRGTAREWDALRGGGHTAEGAPGCCGQMVDWPRGEQRADTAGRDPRARAAPGTLRPAPGNAVDPGARGAGVVPPRGRRGRLVARWRSGRRHGAGVVPRGLDSGWRRAAGWGL